MKKIQILFVLIIICIGCNSRPTTKPVTTVATPPEKPVGPATEVPAATQPESPEEPNVAEDFTALQFNVALGISVKRPRWVLFKNGTYVIFPEVYTDDQIKNQAIKMVSQYTGGAITVTKSSLAKGWIGRTSKGIYTYVSLEDLKSEMPSQSEITAQAKQNILADKREQRVVHINRKKN